MQDLNPSFLHRTHPGLSGSLGPCLLLFPSEEKHGLIHRKGHRAQCSDGPHLLAPSTKHHRNRQKLRVQTPSRLIYPSFFQPHLPPSRNPLTLHLDSTLTVLGVRRGHIAELGNKRPDKPIFFLKPHSSLVTPPSPEHSEWAPLLIPKGVDVHYEIELAVQIRRHKHNLGYWKRKSLDEQKWEQVWNDCIGGYGVAIDFTARNVQEEAKAKGLPWTAAKGQSPSPNQLHTYSLPVFFGFMS